MNIYKVKLRERYTSMTLVDYHITSMNIRAAIAAGEKRAKQEGYTSVMVQEVEWVAEVDNPK